MIDLSMPAAALRGALAAIWVAAVVHKLREPHEFRAALGAYVQDTPLGSPRMLNLLARGVVAAEVLAACTLVFLWEPPYSVYAALLSAGILVAYAAAMLFNILRGTAIADCGCTMGGRSGQAVGTALVARNVVLAIAAAGICLGPVPTDRVGAACLAIVLVLAYAIWNEMDANNALGGAKR